MGGNGSYALRRLTLARRERRGEGWRNARGERGGSSVRRLDSKRRFRIGKRERKEGISEGGGEDEGPPSIGKKFRVWELREEKGTEDGMRKGRPRKLVDLEKTDELPEVPRNIEGGNPKKGNEGGSHSGISRSTGGGRESSHTKKEGNTGEVGEKKRGEGSSLNKRLR